MNLSSPASPALEEWLRLAPTPPALKPDQQWHVFLSYRSLNRTWALALYDALTRVGFRVFLDQLELVPGASLMISLQSALQKSAGGVIVWSAANEGSTWCTDEYNTMDTLRRARGAGFHFVVARVDGEPPLLVQNALYEDFGNSPEGPHGSGLIRLMYGVVGQPPSREAVLFAEEVDRETRREIARVDGARLTGDRERLLELGASGGIPWLSSPLLLCRTADALIALGYNQDALDVLKVASDRFPAAIRPQQLRALAFARTADRVGAQRVLSELYAGGHRDPETMGLFARTWMDRYQASGKRHHLERSRDLYLEAFRLFPTDSYTGVNAAAKSVFIGDMATAMTVAKEVEALVGTTAVPGDYWRTATMGEVQLLQGNYEEAARLYHAAVVDAPEDVGSHASTVAQARRLMDHLQTPAAERTRVEEAFT